MGGRNADIIALRVVIDDDGGEAVNGKEGIRNVCDIRDIRDIVR